MMKRSASGKAVELAGLDELDDHRLLSLGVLVDAPVDVGDLEVLERGAGAAHARLAGHDRLVDLRGERLRR